MYSVNLSHSLHTNLESLSVLWAVTEELIRLHVIPDLSSGNRERINVHVVRIAVAKKDVPSVDLATINRLVAHGLGDVGVKVADH